MNFSKKSIFLHFGGLWICSCLVILVADRLILTPEFFVNNDQVLALIPSENMTFYERMQRWSFIYQGLYLLVKVTLIASILHTAMSFHQIKVSFLNVIMVVIFAEYVFVTQGLVKALWFYQFYPHGTLLEWHSTYPLSVVSFLGNIPANWIYPLSVINLYELAYWFVLAFGLSKVTALAFDHALKVVVCSYLPALAIWVVAASFSSLLFFPSHS